MKFLLPIETGYLNKSVRQSMLPPPSHTQQSSLMALTSVSSSGHSNAVNEILLQLLGGELAMTGAAGTGGLSDFSNPNDSIENGANGERVKRHFNLVKSNKSMALDELKFKGFYLSLFLIFKKFSSNFKK